METAIFLVLMLSGTVLLGLNDVHRKYVLTKGFDEQILLSVSFLGSGIILAIPLAFIGVPEIKAGFWTVAIITVALNLVSQNLFIRAFALSDASLIGPLRLIIPVLVIGTGYIFLREVPSMGGILGIIATVIGLAILLQPSFSFSLERGVVYGLLGSVLFAISFPLDKIAIESSSALFATTMILSLIGIALTIGNALRTPGFLGRAFALVYRTPWHFVGIIAAQAFGVLLTNAALSYSLVAYASSLKRLQALWTVIFAGMFLKESQIRRRLIAVALLFVGIIGTLAY